MTTSVAAAGPLLVAVTVNVTVSPTSGVGVVDGLGDGDVGVDRDRGLGLGRLDVLADRGRRRWRRAVLTMRPAALAWLVSTV